MKKKPVPPNEKQLPIAEKPDAKQSEKVEDKQKPTETAKSKVIELPGLDVGLIHCFPLAANTVIISGAQKKDMNVRSHIRILDIDSGKPIKSSTLDGPFSPPVYSKFTKQLIGRGLAGKSHALLFVDPFLGGLVKFSTPSKSSSGFPYEKIQISPDGRTLASARPLGRRNGKLTQEIALKDVVHGTTTFRTQIEAGLIQNVFFDETGGLLGCVCQIVENKSSHRVRWELRCWNVPTYVDNNWPVTNAIQIPLGDTVPLQPFFVKERAAVGLLQNFSKFLFYDCLTGNQLPPVYLLPEKPLAITPKPFAFSHKQKLLALVRPDSVSVWRVANTDMKLVLRHSFFAGKEKSIHTVTFGPDDRTLLVTYSTDGQAPCLEVVRLNQNE